MLRCLITLLNHSNPVMLRSYRKIQIGAKGYAKKFVDSENDYASTVLNNPKTLNKTELHSSFPSEYVQKIIKPPDSQELCSNRTEETVQRLAALATSVKNECRGTLTIQDRKFENFIDEFVHSVSQFSDEQLARSLQALSNMGEISSIFETNYLSLWTSLDSECVERIPKWNVDTLLYMADQWYPLRLAKQGKFVNKAVWKISNRLRKLPPKQLVKTVFYINLTRVPVENMMDIEVNFNQNFEAFSMDDVAVMCMGFFKTETPIRNADLLEKIYHKLIGNISTIQEIPLTAILKLLRYSSRIPQVASMESLLTALEPEIPRLSILACLHIALLGSDIHVCHPTSLELIVDKFSQNLRYLRLKDMERIAFVLAHNNIEFKDFRDKLLCQAILLELPNKVAEIVEYPKCFIALLHFLSMKNIYNTDFISAGFEKRFLQLAYSKNIAGAGREAVTLDAFTAINLCGQYSGNRFPPDAFRLICKLTQDYLPNPKYKLTKSDRMLLDIQATFHTIRNEHCRIIHLLPHYQRPDVLFCLDKLTGQVLSLDTFLSSNISGNHEIMTRKVILQERTLESNLRLVAIVVGSWNCYIRGAKRRTGGYAMKLQQLKQLQFDTVEIPWYEWPVFSRDDMQRYLTSKLAHLMEPLSKLPTN